MKHTWRILTTTEDPTGRVIRRTVYRFRATGRALNAILEALTAKGHGVLVTRVEGSHA